MAKFEVFQDKGGDWRWRLVAPNGKIIADSGEGYSSKQACLDGIDSVKRNLSGKFETYQDKGGGWRWRLLATNGRIIADSGEGYSSKEACDDGIASVRKDAPDAEMV